jgi:L-alanine-DL-glutamate epimerase-like enolase superfamily enzyme
MDNEEKKGNFSRRKFIKAAGVFAASPLAFSSTIENLAAGHRRDLKTIKIVQTDSNFEREPLVRPFGFKGGYMTEMWQTASKIKGESGIDKVGICTQNVLYADADVFSSHSEAGGNALMYALTDRSLQLSKNIPFKNPVELLDIILPKVYAEGQRLTGKKNLNKIFALNSLIGVDNAAWLLYAAENNLNNFSAMIPAAYKPALSHRNEKVAIVYLASYNLPVQELKKAVNEQGYFLIKIKIGQPGTQAEMLQKDKLRLSEVHNAIKDATTGQTKNGKLYYALDANGRYEKKETLLELVQHAKRIGAFDQILFIEEPLHEANEENVADVGIRIGADESAVDEEGVLRRLQQGYRLVVLKGIAKTLSMSLKKAQLAFERDVPCICADLTVNPILVDWHKNLAAGLKPFPGLGMGVLETNGDLNYKNWQKMQSYHTAAGATWTKVRNGVFELGDDFYNRSGGIFEPSSHYEEMFKKSK